MSADAKAWTEDDGSWRGLHDGPCMTRDGETVTHDHFTAYDLSALLESLEFCCEGSIRWEFRTYPDGKVGLVGWTY